MSLAGKKLRAAENGHFMFWCPGCKEYHVVNTQPSADQPKKPTWSYNGNPDAPTFSPSILVRHGHHIPGYSNKGFCDKSGGTDPCTCLVCHSFVTDGMIQFLSDCTHDHAGQTVPLPDL